MSNPMYIYKVEQVYNKEHKTYSCAVVFALTKQSAIERAIKFNCFAPWVKYLDVKCTLLGKANKEFTENIILKSEVL